MVPRPVFDAVIVAAAAFTGAVIVGSFAALDRLRKQHGDMDKAIRQQARETDSLKSKLESLKKN